MPAVRVTDLKARATQIMRRVETGSEFMVTKRGRPIAMILPIADDELEDWILAHHAEAVRRRTEAFERIAAGEYVTAKELRSRLRRLRRGSRKTG